LRILRFDAVVELAKNIRASFKRTSGVAREAPRAPARREVSLRRSEKTSLVLPDARTMPDFVIIGAQKCGTTFLYNLLTQHPHVEPATKKEIHYFDHRSSKSPRWYHSHFPPRKEGLSTITGESTPYYLFHPHTARRMAQVVPEAQLITVLRNPADRAYSHYHQEVRRGHEPLTFEEAIEAEEGRLRGEVDRMLKDEHYVSFNHQNFSYLARGIYVDQLVEWSRFFGDEQQLVLKSEDLFDQTLDVLDSVLGFLGMPGWYPEVLEPCLKGSYAPMNPVTRRQLRDYFEPHNRRLYEYLGVDFGW
jgi:hypothetical protein